MYRCTTCKQIKPENRECPSCTFVAWAGSTPSRSNAPKVKTNLREMQDYTGRRRHGRNQR